MSMEPRMNHLTVLELREDTDHHPQSYHIPFMTDIFPPYRPVRRNIYGWCYIPYSIHQETIDSKDDSD